MPNLAGQNLEDQGLYIVTGPGWPLAMPVSSTAYLKHAPELKAPVSGALGLALEFVSFADEQAAILNAVGRVRPIAAMFRYDKVSINERKHE
jgi:hypothetical protein